LIVIALAQALVAFNVTTLKMSVDAIVEALSVPATHVNTAIVVYALMVAGLILLGARIGRAFGFQRMFRATTAVFGVAMAVMAVSTGSPTMICAQIVAGAATAALLPTLVALIMAHYEARQRTRALSWLGLVQTMGAVPAFLLAGMITTWIGWRFAFGLMAVLAIVVHALGDSLRSSELPSRAGIDGLGALLVAASILLIGLGFEYFVPGSTMLAQASAPERLRAMLSGTAAIVCGVVLLKILFLWSRKRRSSGHSPLIPVEIFDVVQNRASLFSMFAVGLIGSSLTFFIPLYMEVVQGHNSLYTAIAVLPFLIAGYAAGILVTRFYGRMPPRGVARSGFGALAVGSLLLAVTINNDWETTGVIFGMTLAGAGEGALVTLLFDLLVLTAPRNLTDEVSTLCSSTTYLAVGVGTALSAVLVTGVLGIALHQQLAFSPVIVDSLRSEVNLDQVSFVSNDRLSRVLSRTSATTEQVDEAVRINTAARLVALRISLLILGIVAMAAILAARGLPQRAEIPVSQPRVDPE